MDSVKILEDYLTQKVGRKDTRAAFAQYIQSIPNEMKTQVRYVYGTFIRVTMYKEGTVSAQELLIKVRDLILYTRSFECGPIISDLVQRYGAELGLFCDQFGTVNTNLILPNWLPNKEFVKRTYDLENFRDESPYVISDLFLTGAVKKFNTYKSFEIKAAVHIALNLPDGYTYLASLPTGAGKSLITQMLSYYTDGLTIVVVPTVALAIDQFLSAVGTLKDEFAEHVYYYRGEQSDQEYGKIIDGIKSRNAKLLFISPEALLKNIALSKLIDKCAKSGYLKNIVVDEAHIVPDWGVLFRPDFQILAFSIKRWKQESDNRLKVVLLSATLPDDTVDILKHLFAPDGKIIEYRCDALRKEPQFCFYATKTVGYRWSIVEELIRILPKPMIIYFLEPAEVIEFQKKLRQKGYLNIQAFHGDTKDTDRARILQDWKDEKSDVILATSAFGIGVDKANVRTVIHACVPENLSRFYQEVGRAGRDGKASLSILLPYIGKDNEGSDLEKAYSLVRGRVLRVETMVSRWSGLMNSALTEGDIVDLDTNAVPEYFTDEAAEYAGKRNSGWNINLLLFLHRVKFIDILDAYYRVDSNSYHMKARVLRVMELSSEELMAESLQDLRAAELKSQVDGYSRIRELVRRPERRCWGTAFHSLYPLTSDSCNGCPIHTENSFSSEMPFKIRKSISYRGEPAEPSRALSFAMRSYTSMLLRNKYFPEVRMEELSDVVEKLNRAGIMTLVGELSDITQMSFRGLVLTKDEFIFMADQYPGFFNHGVLAVFGDDEYQNSQLFERVSMLNSYGYRTILYCSDDLYISGHNRIITDFYNCKIRNPSDLI